MVLQTTSESIKSIWVSRWEWLQMSLVWLRPSVGPMRQPCKWNWRTIITCSWRCRALWQTLYSTERFEISFNGFWTTTYTDFKAHITLCCSYVNCIWIIFPLYEPFCMVLRTACESPLNLLFLIEKEFYLSLCVVVAPECRSHETTLQVKLEDNNTSAWRCRAFVGSTSGYCIQQKGLKSLTTDFEPRLEFTQIEDFRDHIMMFIYSLYLNNIPFNMNRFVCCFGLRVNSIKFKLSLCVFAPQGWSHETTL